MDTEIRVRIVERMREVEADDADRRSPAGADADAAGQIGSRRVARITRIDSAAWKAELDSHAQWFQKLGSPLPEALLSVHKKMKTALA